MRTASEVQVDAFLVKAFEAVQSKSHGKVWVSTSGDGVSWLHLRIDTRPKYYQHAAYARM